MFRKQLFNIFDGWQHIQALYVQINHNFNTKSRRGILAYLSVSGVDIAGFLSAWESGRSDDKFFEYLNTYIIVIKRVNALPLKQEIILKQVFCKALRKLNNAFDSDDGGIFSRSFHKDLHQHSRMVR
uniref:Uncharacterized protein n=1 Tax=Rhizophagus irregularis (strain DAOM 181602 / DAOM 197198 / MUCL 43194) TaxID=747089 RepID=U9UB94_RHIID